MHASSFENMRRCVARYVANDRRYQKERVAVVDVGGVNVNGGYRELFADPRFEYRTVDIAEGADIVLKDPYRISLEDKSADIVISGQMLEHCEFFWLSFAEMVRILKPGGHLFLIAPSSGPIHRYPVDCYRFYPDAYGALAKYANCKLVECWLDERGPWRDLVGVFEQPGLPELQETSVPPLAGRNVQFYDPVNSPPGTAEEEAMGGEVHYLEVLAEIHAALRPSRYFEIGVRHGRSIALAQAEAIGVDPAPDIKVPLKESVRLVEMTSDDFFADAEARSKAAAPDLAFIDGMHLFEYALRDFMNVERMAKSNTVVVIDDVFPLHPAQADRERHTRVWTGDVWKLYHCLASVRPDLFLLPVNTAPTGLLLVCGLDPDNRVLWDRYNPIVRKYVELQGPPPDDILERKGAVSPTGAVFKEMLAILKNGQVARRDESLASLRAAYSRNGAA